MNLVVALGKDHPARIVKQVEMTWEGYVALLSKAPESADKASRGWSCPARFAPAYRDSENLQARYALTLDYDHVTPGQMARVLADVENRWTHLAYTTWSHTEKAPRWRLVVPFNRPASYDEFQAVSRRVAGQLGQGIELVARESHVPAQMMFLPTVKPGARQEVLSEVGAPLDVDAVLAEYADWTDKTSWPRRLEADGVHEHGEIVDSRTKPGIIGAFCRAFTVEEAIQHFDLPYDRVR